MLESDEAADGRRAIDVGVSVRSEVKLVKQVDQRVAVYRRADGIEHVV